MTEAELAGKIARILCEADGVDPDKLSIAGTAELPWNNRGRRELYESFFTPNCEAYNLMAFNLMEAGYRIVKIDEIDG